VSPTTYPGTCTHCGQRVLCRLDVSLLEEEDEQEDGFAAEVGRG
jgi:ATP-dependent helicase/nuclease subunit B